MPPSVMNALLQALECPTVIGFDKDGKAYVGLVVSKGGRGAVLPLVHIFWLGKAIEE